MARILVTGSSDGLRQMAARLTISLTRLAASALVNICEMCRRHAETD
jgi:hypothetical protein